MTVVFLLIAPIVILGLVVTVPIGFRMGGQSSGVFA
jgi:hypothetical protein